MGVAVGLFGLVFGLGALVLGLLIGAVLLRASVAIVKSLFKLHQSPQQSAAWSQNPYLHTKGGSPMMQNPMMGGPQGGYGGYPQQANPYSAPMATPSYAGTGVLQLEVLPTPTIPKAMLIIFVTFIINMAVGFVAAFLRSATGGDPVASTIINLFGFVINLGLFVVVLKSMLPTSFLWSSAVTGAYFLICLVIGLVIALFLMVPLMMLRG